MISVGIFLFPDFEEIEAISVIDVLRRSGIHTEIISLSERVVTGAHGIAIQTDAVGLPKKDSSAIILPGGAGVFKLRHNKALEDFFRRHYEQGKLIAAICAAPLILDDIGILDHHEYTAYHSLSSEFKQAKLQEKQVVVDGNVITGCGPSAAIAFGLAIVEKLSSPEKAQSVAQGMLYNFSLQNNGLKQG